MLKGQNKELDCDSMESLRRFSGGEKRSYEKNMNMLKEIFIDNGIPVCRQVRLLRRQQGA